MILEPVNAESKADLEDGEKETPRGHWARSFSLTLKASAARGGHRGRATALGEAAQILAFRLLGQLCLIGWVLLE